MSYTGTRNYTGFENEIPCFQMESGRDRNILFFIMKNRKFNISGAVKKKKILLKLGHFTKHKRKKA